VATELVEVTLLLEVRPMTALEISEEGGDDYYDEEDDGEGAVYDAADSIAEGIAHLLEGDGDLAREVLAGSNHFVKILSARSQGAQLVGPDEVAA
jgi:hypothetical protein